MYIQSTYVHNEYIIVQRMSIFNIGNGQDENSNHIILQEYKKVQVALWKKENKQIKNLDIKKNFDRNWDSWIENVMESVNARKNRTMSMFSCYTYDCHSNNATNS